MKERVIEMGIVISMKAIAKVVRVAPINTENPPVGSMSLMIRRVKAREIMFAIQLKRRIIVVKVIQ